MLARGNRQSAALRERCPSKQAKLVDESPVRDQQLCVAGELDQPIVEFDVRCEVRVDIALRGRPFHPFDAGAQLADLLGRDRLREPAADKFVEHRAQFVDFVGFLDRDQADEYASVLFEPHEAGFLERAEGLAHRAARDAQAIGDRRLVELLPPGARPRGSCARAPSARASGASSI